MIDCLLVVCLLIVDLSSRYLDGMHRKRQRFVEACGCLVGCLLSVVWLVVCSFGWLVGWLVGWLSGWVFFVSLVGWLFCLLFYVCVCVCFRVSVSLFVHFFSHPSVFALFNR